MSKAVLVMDMPNSCGHCLFNNYGNGCQINGEDNFDYCKSKPDYCPLHELPEKMNICGKYPQPNGMTPSYKIGWNACIDEITGESEGKDADAGSI